MQGQSFTVLARGRKVNLWRLNLLGAVGWSGLGLELLARSVSHILVRAYFFRLHWQVLLPVKLLPTPLRRLGQGVLGRIRVGGGLLTRLMDLGIERIGLV